MSESSESIPVPPAAPLLEPPPAATSLESPSVGPGNAPPTMAYPTGAGQGYPPNPNYTPYRSYGYPYPMMPGQAPELPKGTAITGMVLGIVGLCTSVFYIGGVVGIVGLIFSIIAIRGASRGRNGGKGMAIAGLVTAILAIIVNAIEIIFIVWVVHTASNCDQYDPNTHPLTGTQTQYNECMRSGILGN